MNNEKRVTLTEAELYEITGYHQVRKQHAHFVRLGVPAIIKPDGTLSVGRAHYEKGYQSVNIGALVKSVKTVRKTNQ